MQNITVHYCLIDYDQRFAAIDKVCCRKVSFFNTTVHHYAIGLLSSWERLGIATTFAIWTV